MYSCEGSILDKPKAFGNDIISQDLTRSIFSNQPQPLLGESPSGGSFEVALEADSLARLSECDGGFDPPRTPLGAVRHFTGIVSFELIVQIVGMADIVVLGIVHPLKDIDV